MYKNLLLIAIASLFFVACGNQENKADKKVADVEVAELVSLTPDNFYDEAETLIDQTINIQGTVMHVCTHGGKKMFIFGEDAETTVKLTIGEGMAAFNSEWEGSDVIVKGIVKEFRVDEDYLVAQEADIQEKLAAGEGMNEEEKKAAHACGELLDDASVQEQMDHLEVLRAEIAESGDDHISYFSVEVVEYEVIESADSDVESHEGHDHDADAEGHEGHDHDSHEGHNHD